jgi:SAM-dependent methyltransferase
LTGLFASVPRMGSDQARDPALDWEEQARNWIAWVRKPEFDSYWRYRADFFDLVPSPGAATLDLGCGEGRVSRDLIARGHRVTGIDRSPTLIEAAREADPTGEYLLGDAADLPFADASFDLVVAYNVLMDVHDLPATMREAARVLSPGGTLCLSITHPMNDAGRFEDGRLIIERSYFDRHRVADEMERDGLRMVFHGWTHSLNDYTAALEENGLLIQSLREPRFPGTGRATPIDLIPLHLWIKARKP